MKSSAGWLILPHFIKTEPEETRTFDECSWKDNKYKINCDFFLVSLIMWPPYIIRSGFSFHTNSWRPFSGERIGEGWEYHSKQSTGMDKIVHSTSSRRLQSSPSLLSAQLISSFFKSLLLGYLLNSQTNCPLIREWVENKFAYLLLESDITTLPLPDPTVEGRCEILPIWMRKYRSMRSVIFPHYSYW